MDCGSTRDAINTQSLMKEYLHLEKEEKEGIIISVIREHLLSLCNMQEDEKEDFMTLWLECAERMGQLLVLVVLQTIVKKRNTTMTELANNVLEVLNSVPDECIECPVFLRIFLYAFIRLIWTARRKTPSSHLNSDDVLEPFELDGSMRLIKLVENCQSRFCKIMILTFLHQLLLENPSLIRQVYERRACSISLVPWLVEFVPSLHVLIDRILAEVKAEQEFDAYRLYFATYLAMKYPLPRTFDLCRSVLEHCDKYANPQSVVECLDIAILSLRAFPNLMESLVPILAKWTGLYSTDTRFMSASTKAAQTISEINSLVKQPIYSRIIELL